MKKLVWLLLIIPWLTSANTLSFLNTAAPYVSQNSHAHSSEVDKDKKINDDEDDGDEDDANDPDEEDEVDTKLYSS